MTITMGDPSGIGPEIIVKSFLDETINTLPLIVCGNLNILQKRIKDLGLESKLSIESLSSIEEYSYKKNIISVYDPYPELGKFEEATVQKICGEASYKYLECACDWAMNKKVSSIITGPIHKESISLANIPFPGHTEILAHLSNTKSFAMVLSTATLKVIHVTTHISLSKMIQTLNKERIIEVCKIADDFMKLTGVKSPKIAIAGLNPHAGENGLFGSEEKEIIIPALEQLRKEGYIITGPEAPDTVFLHGHQGKYDMVVALYHDQGHIPVKMLGLEGGINITVGLPFIRTSVDHGTAFDIVKKYGTADPESLKKSILLAKSLTS